VEPGTKERGVLRIGLLDIEPLDIKMSWWLCTEQAKKVSSAWLGNN
jgi:hypothetical protein